jgi:Concanavalin A-like lectin/glucanases superfamily
MTFSSTTGEIKLYADGSQVGSTFSSGMSSINNTSGDFVIGADPSDGPGMEVDGLVDDVRIWGRALSGTEISNIYNAPANFVNGTNLQRWWKLDSAYTDASGNGNMLTAQNSPVFAIDVPYISSGSSIVADNYTYAETNYANPHARAHFSAGLRRQRSRTTTAGISRARSGQQLLPSSGTIRTA